MAKAKFPLVKAAEDYAKRVIAGKIPACKWIILLCQKHLDDLEQAKSDGFPFYFDPAKAESRAAIDAMHAAFAAADAKEPGIRRATVDYANPDSALKPPAFSDASDGLKAMVQARRGE